QSTHCSGGSMKKVVALAIAFALVLLTLLVAQQRARTRAAEERAAALATAAQSAEAQAKIHEETAAQNENALRHSQARLEESTVRLAKLNESAASRAAPTNRSSSATKSDGPLIKDPETR